MLFLHLHGEGNIVNEVFWGLWLVPFGLLVIKSGFIPRFLGYWLLLDGFAYVVLSAIGILAPQYYSTAFTYAQPALFGELAIMLFLVIKGANVPPLTGSSQWRYVCALDHEEEHDREFAKERGLRVGECGAVVLWRQYPDGTEHHIGEAVEQEPVTQEPRYESRLDHEQPERNEPQAPKDFVDDISLTMQVKEEHRQRVLLLRIEYREVTTAVHQGERGDPVQRIEEENRCDNDASQDDHDRGQELVHIFEEAVQCKAGNDTEHASV